MEIKLSDLKFSNAEHAMRVWQITGEKPRFCADCNIPMTSSGKRCVECEAIYREKGRQLRFGTWRMKAKLLRERGEKCQRCGAQGKVEMHHVIPVDQGGELVPENLLLLCPPCHRVEQNKKGSAFQKNMYALLARTEERLSQ